MANKLDAAVVLASLEKEAAPLIRAVNKIEVTDNDSYNKLSEKVAALKELKKLADEKEKSLTDPLKKVITDIRSLFLPFTTMVSKLEIEAKDLMLAHVQRNKAKQIAITNDLQNGKIAKLSTATKKLSQLELTATSSQVRKIWVVEMVNPELTPREYLVPDEVAIKAALKAGKKVPGWKMVQRDTIAI